MEISSVSWIIALVLLLIALIVCYYLAKKLLKRVWQHNAKSRAQKRSVFSRYRNGITAAIQKDMFDIRIAGLWSVEKTAKEAMEQLMPFTLAELEETRKKNPEAWRDVMEFLLPLALAVKVKIQETPKEMISNTIGGIMNAGTKVAPPDEDQT